MRFRYAIHPVDIRRLGGVVRVAEGRDWMEGRPFFQVGHVSRGGDIVWQSRPIFNEDHAHAAARVLADFVGADFRT
jgi:hypothetical protein